MKLGSFTRTKLPKNTRFALKSAANASRSNTADRVLADQPQPLRQVDRTRRRLGNHTRLAGDRGIKGRHRFQWYGIPRASTGTVESVIE